MSRSKRLKFLSGIMAAVFLMTSLMLGSVSADDNDLLSDDVVIDTTQDGLVIDGDITTGEETDEGIGEETGEEAGEETGEETSEETDEEDDEKTGEETDEETNEDSDSIQFSSDSVYGYAPGGNRTLPRKVPGVDEYQPNMPNAHVVEVNFNHLAGWIGGQGAATTAQYFYFDNITWDGKPEIKWQSSRDPSATVINPSNGGKSNTTGVAWSVRYSNLPYNKVYNGVSAWPGESDNGKTAVQSDDAKGLLEGIELLAILEQRASGPVYNFESDGVTQRQDGGYFAVTVPPGATGARFSAWVHEGTGDRVFGMRKGPDPINGDLVGPGQYRVRDHTPVISQENAPLKIDFDLPGPGVYTFSANNTYRVALLRLEYTFEERPELTAAGADLKVTSLDLNQAAKTIEIDWTGNIGWEGVDKVSAQLYDVNGEFVPPPSSSDKAQWIWETRYNENKTLRFQIEKSGFYRVKLLGSRESEEDSGMIDQGMGAIIDNYEDGFAIESSMFPPTNQDPYFALVALQEPVILTSYLNKYNTDEFIVKWLDVPEAERYQLQYKRSTALTWTTSSRYNGIDNDFVFSISGDNIRPTAAQQAEGQPAIFDFRVVALRGEGVSSLDRVEGPQSRVTIELTDRVWYYGSIGKAYEGSTYDSIVYLYEDADTPITLTGSGSMGFNDDGTANWERGASYTKTHRFYGDAAALQPQNTNYRNIPISISDDPNKSAAEGGWPEKIYMQGSVLSKYTDFHNGFSYFYTEIDPDRQNWSLEATFKIANRNITDLTNQPTDTQSAFGLIVTDIAPQSDLLPYFNSIMVGMGRHRFMPPTGTSIRVEGAPGLVVKTGWSDPIGATSPEGITCWGIDTMCFDHLYRDGLKSDPDMPSYDLRWISHDKWNVKKMAEGETFVFKMVKDNTGFHGYFISAVIDGRLATYYSESTGNLVSTFAGNPLTAYGEYVKVDANGNYVRDPQTGLIEIVPSNDPNAVYMSDYHVRLQDDDRYYVGMFVTRKMSTEITNIKWEEFSPDDPKSGTKKNRPTKFQAMNLKLDTTNTTGATNFEAVFVSNVTGSLQIFDRDMKPITQPRDITGNKRTPVQLRLDQGANRFLAKVTIDRTKPQELDEGYDFAPGVREHTLSFTITVNTIAPTNQAVYVSPAGTATGSGSKANPLSLRRALEYSQPGQQIVMLGGTYRIDSRINISRGNNGGTLMAEPGARVIFDFTRSTNGAIVLNGDNWHLYDFEITNNTRFIGRPLQISGHGNRVEKIRVYDVADTGIQISGASTEAFEDWPHNNLVISSESRNCTDIQRNNADGFAAKITVGNGNMFKYCIASFNVDDGWDMFAQASDGVIGPVIVDSCVAYANGLPDYDYDDHPSNKNRKKPAGEEDNPDYWFLEAKIGDGNGFKMGGGGMPVSHVVRNSIALYNYEIGFDANTGCGLKVYNCTAFRNEKGIQLTSAYRFKSEEEKTRLMFEAYNNLIFESGSIRFSEDKVERSPLDSSLNSITRLGSPQSGSTIHPTSPNIKFFSNGKVKTASDGSVEIGIYDSDSEFFIPEVETLRRKDGSKQIYFDLFNKKDPSNPFKAPAIAADGTIDMHGFLLPTADTPLSDKSVTWYNQHKGADFRNLKPDPGSVITLKPPVPDIADGGSRGTNTGGSNRGGGGGSLTPSVSVNTSTPTLSTNTAVSAVERAVSNVLARAQAEGKDVSDSVVANVTFRDVSIVTGETFKAINATSNESGARVNLIIDSMSADKKSVDVRVIVDPSKADSTLNLSGSTYNKTAMQVKARFDRFYSDVVAVISLGQAGDFGQEVKVAAKVNKEITNDDKLNFYSYDTKTNKFKPIKVSNYKIDKNGYLHFSTSVGGSIIVTKGPIKKI